MVYKMKLIFLPDISFFKTKKNSKIIKNFQNFLARINGLFPNTDLVTNLECVLLKRKIKNKSKNFGKLHAENSFAKFLKNNQILNVCLANNHSFDFGEKGFKQMTKYFCCITLTRPKFYHRHIFKFIITKKINQIFFKFS